nr:uroporphyrinogen decarboxylase family protein [Candidatus Njordarchaeum guaymaensis]
MNKEKRVLAALRREEPDVVPTHVLDLDANNVDEVLGKPPTNDFDLIKQFKIQFPDSYIDELNRMLNPIFTTVFTRMLKTASVIGLDTMPIATLYFKFRSDHEFTDIFGRLWELQNNEGNVLPYYRTGLITSKEAWDKWPKPDPKKYVNTFRELYKSVTGQVKVDEIVPMVNNGFAGIFDSTWQGLGLPFFSKMLVYEPKFIKEIFELYTDFFVGVFNAFMDVGARIFFEGDDIAYHFGPMMSPRQFEQLILPCYKRLTDTVHSRKGLIIFHSDGFLEPLLDMIVASGFDGLQGLEPTAGMSLARVKKRVGDKLALLGNIDIGYVLSKGTKEDVEEDVKRAIREAGHGGGFMVSPTNMHHAVKVQNLKWMVEATHEYGKYPLIM